jgi:hypothetical protein
LYDPLLACALHEWLDAVEESHHERVMVFPLAALTQLHHESDNCGDAAYNT